jgi:type ISP restriction-modification system protein/N-6 DNA methylase
MVSEEENVSNVALRSYLKKVEKAYHLGNATEHTYRPALQELLETLFADTTATNEPKRVACGAPDLIVTHKQIPLGYIETKDINTSLDQTERTSQMTKYLGSLANLILTDYLEFRWYVDGEKRLTARLAKTEGKGKLIAESDGIEQVTNLLLAFMVTQTPIASTPKELATRMASLAQLIRSAIHLAFESEEGGGSLHLQMQGFRQVLLPDLSYEQFADMYAQTICYGLFAARCNCNDKPNMHFTREHAVYDIPKTNPFLRKMFGYIAGADLDERIVWAVDDLAELLNRSDMDAILKDFGRRTRQEDPIVHFYETFLAEYNPKLRELRGVYYTPEPVVSYIVRSVDYLLKKDFGLVDGLADDTILKATSSDGKSSLQTHKVQILDPATGTATFLHSIIDLIYESFKGNRGMWSSYVSEHLLPRLFGFELLMAPYAVAHMKLGIQLADTGYDFRGKERLGIYLTNTLEEGFEGDKLPFVEWLVEEATAAGNVKYDAPVMVIIGNPPYSGHSANKSQWIIDLLHGKDNQTGRAIGGNYFEVEGQPLGERNPKWLNDDYVKFIRFAQWRIERTGYGILAFITNHGYLDNPTFRGMRQSLMQSFDEIYVLNLHGNSKKKERSPDDTKDENVFDIQQGVAIGIFIKRQRKPDVSRKATVHHADLWGLREIYENTPQGRQLVGGKYHWLTEHNIATTEWIQLEPQSPFYLFKPQNGDLKIEYERGWSITEIMPVNGWGIATRKDYLLVDFSREVLINRFRDIRSLNPTEAIMKYGIKESPFWNFGEAKKKLSPDTESHVRPVLFRPFDTRFVYYEKCMIERGDHRFDLMSHMFQENLSFITVRRSEGSGVPNHFYCSKDISVLHSTSAKEGNFVFPLYLYPNLEKNTLFDIDEISPASDGRRPNLSQSFIKSFSDILNMQFVQEGKGDLQQSFKPEDVFHYMYAIFYSPTYRLRYADFLKADFPRLPLTSNVDLFRELCKFGERLVGLHLTETKEVIITSYPVDGTNIVEKVEYTQPADKPESGRVCINKTQYFDNVPPEVWEFYIGGYQVCHKWLKDRKGRTLSFDDIRHYQKIVTALAETINLMSQIEEAIDEHGGWPIE